VPFRVLCTAPGDIKVQITVLIRIKKQYPGIFLLQFLTFFVGNFFADKLVVCLLQKPGFPKVPATSQQHVVKTVVIHIANRYSRPVL